jgi:hypothetical protein
MEVSTFKDKFSQLLPLRQEGQEFVGSSGNVEIRLAPFLDHPKMLSWATLIFPPLNPENEDTSAGMVSAVTFLVLATGEKEGVVSWIQNAIGNFTKDQIYEEAREKVFLRLSSVDRMFCLLARFDSFGL